MIKNEKQRKVAQKKLKGLMAAREAESDKVAWRSYSRLIDELDAQISDYEDIKSGLITRFSVSCFDDVGDALVKARIANGWTQKKMASKAGVSEQLIQRDEARSFENAGLARVADLLDILGYDLEGTIRPKSATGPGFGGTAATSAARAVKADLVWSDTGAPVVFTLHDGDALVTPHGSDADGGASTGNVT